MNDYYIHFLFQEAMKKDTLERGREPEFDLKGYLMNAYIHPVFKGDDDDDDENFSVADGPEAEQVLVATRRQSRRNTPVPSKYNGSDSPSLPETVNDQISGYR
jgi:calcium permeable stress-gated cation channel